MGVSTRPGPGSPVCAELTGEEDAAAECVGCTSPDWVCSVPACVAPDWANAAADCDASEPPDCSTCAAPDWVASTAPDWPTSTAQPAGTSPIADSASAPSTASDHVPHFIGMSSQPHREGPTSPIPQASLPTATRVVTSVGAFELKWNRARKFPRYLPESGRAFRKVTRGRQTSPGLVTERTTRHSPGLVTPGPGLVAERTTVRTPSTGRRPPGRAGGPSPPRTLSRPWSA